MRLAVAFAMMIACANSAFAEGPYSPKPIAAKPGCFERCMAKCIKPAICPNRCSQKCK